MESWQVFRAAKKNLPPGFLQQLYTRSSRLLDLWAADPRVCECTARNPLDRIRDLLDQLDTVGERAYACWAVDYVARPLGGRFAPFDEGCTSDKGTVDGEAVDVNVALSKLIETVREAMADDRIDTAERAYIKEKARTIKQEVDQLLDACGMPGGV